MSIIISNEQTKYNIDVFEEVIKRVVAKVLEIEDIIHNCQVSVIIIDNEQIKELNKNTRGIDSKTDVLSYPILEFLDFTQLKKNLNINEYIDLDTGEIVLGDIAISIERAYEQSQEYGHTIDREIAFLTTHGMLHLLGYDHQDETETKKMREKEEKVLSILRMVR